MRKLALAILVLSLLVAIAVPAAADDGFVLIGADNAYALFERDGCYVEASYIDAVAVRYFERPLAKPHEDIDVRLWGTCGPEAVTRNISGGHPDAQIERLDWAYLVNDFEVRNDAGFRAVINLRWEAYGDSYVRIDREPGMRASHLIRDAYLEGSVVIDGLGTFTAEDHLVHSHLDHYTEIQRSNLP